MARLCAMTDGSALRRRAGWWRAIYACAALTIAMTAHHGAAQSTKSLEQIENDEKLKRAIEPINDAESKLHAMLRRREVDPARAVRMPCFIYAGGADKDLTQARNSATRIAEARFTVFPDLTHGETFDRSDLVLPHAVRFLEHALKSR
jgi:pimeloyl-ACP methyl ester carboxylesterase